MHKFHKNIKKKKTEKNTLVQNTIGKQICRYSISYVGLFSWRRLNLVKVYRFMRRLDHHKRFLKLELSMRRMHSFKLREVTFKGDMQAGFFIQNVLGILWGR